MLNAVLYGLLKWWLDAGLWFADSISFLDRMAICLIVVCAYCAAMTALKPLQEPVVLPENKDIDLTPSPNEAVEKANIPSSFPTTECVFLMSTTLPR